MKNNICSYKLHSYILRSLKTAGLLSLANCNLLLLLAKAGADAIMLINYFLVTMSIIMLTDFTQNYMQGHRKQVQVLEQPYKFSCIHNYFQDRVIVLWCIKLKIIIINNIILLYLTIDHQICSALLIVDYWLLILW